MTGAVKPNRIGIAYASEPGSRNSRRTSRRRWTTCSVFLRRPNGIVDWRLTDRSSSQLQRVSYSESFLHITLPATVSIAIVRKSLLEDGESRAILLITT